VRLGHLEVEPLTVSKDNLTFRAPTALNPATTVVSVSLNGQQFTSQPAVHAPAKELTYDYYPDPYTAIYYPAKGPTNGGTTLKLQGYGYTLERPHLSDRLWARFVDPTGQTELAPVQEVPTKQLGIDALTWATPAVGSAGEALLQISLNN
jgi:hypothetical protein